MYAYLEVNSDGSAVATRSNNFTYVGQIVTGSNIPTVVVDTISTVAYKVYTSEDIAGQSSIRTTSQIIIKLVCIFWFDNQSSS